MNKIIRKFNLFKQNRNNNKNEKFIKCIKKLHFYHLKKTNQQTNIQTDKHPHNVHLQSDIIDRMRLEYEIDNSVSLNEK